MKPGYPAVTENDLMHTDLFDYELPASFIAQQPAEPRDSSRLLVLHRADGRIEHRTFADIGDYLRPNDLLIANDSRVIPARLYGHKATGGQVELLLLKPLDDDWQTWECLTRGRRVVNVLCLWSEAIPITRVWDV